VTRKLFRPCTIGCGRDALERLSEVFYARVPSDPLLGPVFAKMSPHHVKHVAAFVGEVFGGPKTYSEQHGGRMSHVIDRLGADLHVAFPDMKGLSPRNLKYVRAFAEAWPDLRVVQQLVA
jgi:hypothetical protein